MFKRRLNAGKNESYAGGRNGGNGGGFRPRFQVCARRGADRNGVAARPEIFNAVKFTVGYRRNDALKAELLRNRGAVAEIYFPWRGFASGRGVVPSEAEQREMEDDLADYVRVGFKTNLLLNGNCYGRRAQARAFHLSVGDCVCELGERFGLGSVTTSSPVIAKFLKANFPGLEVRASVNMEIGSPVGAQYVLEYFDSFYFKREYNWYLEKLRAMRAFCLSNGKKLYLLANSGCLNFCPARTFHDNLVAHQHEISEMDNAFDFKGVCHEFVRSKDNRNGLLRLCNFIRPEDVRLFAGLCDGVKLATRTNGNPAAVVRAYCAAHYAGNLLDLTEPSHSQSLYPAAVENAKIPAGYAEKRLGCGKNCPECGYCDEVQKNATVDMESYLEHGQIATYGKTDK